MIIARAISGSDANAVYSAEHYKQAGGAQRIIAEFLFNQLKFLGTQEEAGKEVLIALVSSYGTKTQKTLKELSLETGKHQEDVNALLNSLVDLRMVRSINGQFEIVHDFLAKTILAELVSSEEREAKKFKQLLSSRAAAYADTRAMLTRNEHLHLYKYRTRIICTESEAQLLLLSHFAGNGPIYFWLHSFPKRSVLHWMQTIRTLKNPPDIRFDQTGRFVSSIYRALIKHRVDVGLRDVTSSFSDYELRFELSNYVSQVARDTDVPLLLRTYRATRSEHVANACRQQLVKFITLSDEDVLDKIAKAPALRDLFAEIAVGLCKKLSLRQIKEFGKARKDWKKLLAIYGRGEEETAAMPIGFKVSWREVS